MPTKGVPIGAMNKLPKLRGSGEGSVKGASDNWPKPRKLHGQTRALKNFATAAARLAATARESDGCGYDERGRRGYSPTGDVPTFRAPDSTFEKHNGPGPDAQKEFEQTRPNVMTFGEQFVELLGEFVDAREQYAHARRHVGGEYANSDDMDKAGNALQAFLDKRFP